jgi:trans-aconitate 2-methyltransferase
MIWNPETYSKFKSERAQPFEDLFRLLVIKDSLQVIDLGCGTGNLTKDLATRLPNSNILGIDSSPAMLVAAKELERPGLRFELGSIEAMEGQWDLVFSHAAIQWLDNHTKLIPRLFSLVRLGGQLAVQLPDNHDSVAHRLIRETALEEPFAQSLRGRRRNIPNLTIEQYAELLYAHYQGDFTVFLKVYPVILENANALAEWNAGTALLPYIQHLPEDKHELFREKYRKKLAERFPTSPVFYPFRRIVFAGTRHV